MRRRDGGASCSKRVNLASKRARVENDMKPLLITFFSLTWCQQQMTLDQPCRLIASAIYKSPSAIYKSPSAIYKSLTIADYRRWGVVFEWYPFDVHSLVTIPMFKALSQVCSNRSKRGLFVFRPNRDILFRMQSFRLALFRCTLVGNYPVVQSIISSSVD